MDHFLEFKKKLKKSFFLFLPPLLLIFGYSFINEHNIINKPSNLKQKLRYSDNLPPNDDKHLKNNWFSKIEIELTNSQNINLIIDVVTGAKNLAIYTVCNVLVNNVFNTQKLRTLGTEDLDEAKKIQAAKQPIIGYLKYKFTYPANILANNNILDIRIDVHGEMDCLIDDYTLDWDKYIHGRCNEVPLSIFDQISYQKSINLNDFINPIALNYLDLKNNDERIIEILNSIYIEPYFTVEDPDPEVKVTYKKNPSELWYPKYSYLLIKKNKNHLFDDKFYFNDYEFVNYNDFIKDNGFISIKSGVIHEYDNNFYSTKKIIFYLQKNTKKQWVLSSAFDSFLEINRNRHFYFNVLPSIDKENVNGLLKNNITYNKSYLQINLLIKEKIDISLIFPLYSEKEYFNYQNNGLIIVQ